MKKFVWKVMAKVFEIIRPLFVKDIDVNEDFTCCACCKPLLRRFLYCSEACPKEHGW